MVGEQPDWVPSDSAWGQWLACWRCPRWWCVCREGFDSWVKHGSGWFFLRERNQCWGCSSKLHFQWWAQAVGPGSCWSVFGEFFLSLGLWSWGRVPAQRGSPDCTGRCGRWSWGHGEDPISFAQVQGGDLLTADQISRVYFSRVVVIESKRESEKGVCCVQ